MERICCIGGAAGASILAVASVDDLMIWAWLLMAAELGVWMLLRKEAQKQIKSVPVLSNPRRPLRRATPDASWR